MTERHLAIAELEAALERLLESPADGGQLELIVRRPAVNERETCNVAKLEVATGLVGDNWRERGSRHMPDGGPDPDMQLNIMNSRVAELVAGGIERMPLAGDQLYIDLDLGDENLPAGDRLAIGDAIVEVTEPPHTGCRKFAERFGRDAMVFVNSGFGRQRNFRGINARVVQSGTIRVGDVARKIGRG